ncbi:MAG: ParB/RepB/Spo0J family partition protein [Thermodesulfovibrionales bacterium]
MTQLSFQIPETWKRESVEIGKIAAEELLEGSLCRGTMKAVAHLGMVFQEIVLRAEGEGYKIVAGRRRVQAAKEAGHTTIPALVFESGTPDEILAMLTIAENMTRSANPGVEAEKLSTIMSAFNWTEQDVADHLGIPVSHVRSRVKLLDLIPEFLMQLKEGKINLNAAKALRKLTKDKQRDLLDVDKLTGKIAAATLREERLTNLLPVELFKLPAPSEADTVETMIKGAIATLERAVEITTNGRKGKLQKALKILKEEK